MKLQQEQLLQPDLMWNLGEMRQVPAHLGKPNFKL